MGIRLGFRFRQGVIASLTWLIVPVIVGIAFAVAVATVALYAAEVLVVEAVHRHRHWRSSSPPVCYRWTIASRASAGGQRTASELRRRGDARIIGGRSGAITDGRDAAVERGHRCRLRRTYGNRLSTGQHALTQYAVSPDAVERRES